MKTGIIDVGGGLRGVYAAGILDYCLDAGIPFDFCIGVLAGSANVTAYMAGQKKKKLFLLYRICIPQTKYELSQLLV